MSLPEDVEQTLTRRQLREMQSAASPGLSASGSPVAVASSASHSLTAADAFAAAMRAEAPQGPVTQPSPVSPFAPPATSVPASTFSPPPPPSLPQTSFAPPAPVAAPITEPTAPRSRREARALLVSGPVDLPTAPAAPSQAPAPAAFAAPLVSPAQAPQEQPAAPSASLVPTSRAANRVAAAPSAPDSRFAAAAPPVSDNRVAAAAPQTSEVDDFGTLFDFETTDGSHHRASTAVILTRTPDALTMSGSLTSAGDVRVTGMMALPEGVGSRGHALGTTDGKDVDSVLLDAELAPSASPVPVAASSAVGTIKPAGEVIRQPTPDRGSKLVMGLSIVAGASAIALAIALILAFMNDVF